MDSLTRKLQTLLVELGLSPERVPHQTEHYVEHLLHLLEVDDEQSLIDYYGLFGNERSSLSEIAHRRGMSDEDMMAHIDRCLRQIAISPEWESIVKTMNKTNQQ